MSEYFTEAFVLKFVKFGVVGFSGLFVDFGTTYICKEWLRIQKFIANSIGFTVAATSNYFLNRIWTFKSQDPNIVYEFTEFFIISLIGLALNNLILWSILKRFKVNFYIAKLFAVGVVTVWNFFANYYVTFAR